MPPQLSVNTSGIDQARLIETRLEELAVERTNLSRQLNNLRARTRSVPPEILSKIFILSATPLRLEAVCSLWREVAWGTPKLLTTIQCNPARDPQRTVTDDSLYLLRLFFKNSGRLEVTVKLLNIDNWQMPNDQLEPLRDILAIVTIEDWRKTGHWCSSLLLTSGMREY